MSGLERSRRARRRRKCGQIVLPIEVAEVELVERLITAGLVPERDRENRAAISEALSRVVSTWTGDTRADTDF